VERYYIINTVNRTSPRTMLYMVCKPHGEFNEE
jgi:hypothetical protein